eukprot:CAMPEP_0171738234 /NCGR_PEP_ID=MMETSP0991-20121206/33442_1 /TAXON_ID=483369 /ORGANISM="non described non described, Strain CCMP2098" /LENGTH=113 /DNA_ID=CAMNT_0012335473 /DNA_START=808 /DNA_END=1147 /DNA_ORIENTATION=+
MRRSTAGAGGRRERGKFEVNEALDSDQAGEVDEESTRWLMTPNSSPCRDGDTAFGFKKSQSSALAARLAAKELYVQRVVLTPGVTPSNLSKRMWLSRDFESSAVFTGGGLRQF